MDVAGLLSQLLNGVQFGLLLFLVASGLTLIFGVLGIINLAHGSLFMVGAYTAFVISGTFGSLALALPVAIVGGLMLGALLERFLFRHFYAREHLDQVLLTFALILIFEEARSLLIGNDFYSVAIPKVFDFSVPITAGFSYVAYRFVVIGLCLALAAVLFFWIERTRTGAIIRAAAEKPEMVDVLGIDARRVHLVVVAVGTALAVTAGALAAPLGGVYPNMGDSLLIVSFVVVVIGGLGSVSGAFWSALLIGLIDTLGKAYGPGLAGTALGNFGAALAAMAVYVLMVGVLLWRPTGLFGRRP
jgi:branched-chain amino acid transport system permease protein